MDHRWSNTPILLYKIHRLQISDVLLVHEKSMENDYKPSINVFFLPLFENLICKFLKQYRLKTEIAELLAVNFLETGCTAVIKNPHRY